MLAENFRAECGIQVFTRYRRETILVDSGLASQPWRSCVYGTLGAMDGGVVSEDNPQAHRLAAFAGHGSLPFAWLLPLLAGVF